MIDQKVKKLFLILMILPLLPISAQRIGDTVQEKPNIVFPDNSWGVDVMFTEGGFGFGSFFRKKVSSNITGFIDFSFSESKDEREVEYVNYFGQTFTVGKKNRAFLLPLYAGIQYRLFSGSLTDNLRPYINAGIGPTFIITTPYAEEFFSSFGNAKLKIAAGGYAGFGANFGISQKNLIGINVRYYFIQLFDEGIERLEGNFDKSLGGFALTINFGIMF